MPEKLKVKLARRFNKETRKAGTKIGVFFKSPKGGVTCFVLSIAYISTTLILLTGLPQWYWVFHNGFVFFLITLRFLYYKSRGWHYYLCEFCYFCNYWLLLLTFLSVLRWFGVVSTILHKYNAELMRSYFLLAEGPLVWSICMFRNAMVFHNLDQMTSLWLHMSPALVGWSFRWHADKIEETFPGLFDFDVDGPMDYKQNFIRTVVLYLALWLIPYYIVRFKLVRGRIKEKGYDTLFHLLTEGKGFLRRPLANFRMRTRTKMYCLVHFMGMILASSIAFIWWRHYVAHTIFLFLQYLFTSYNGAVYYYTAFVRQNTRRDEGQVLNGKQVRLKNSADTMSNDDSENCEGNADHADQDMYIDSGLQYCDRSGTEEDSYDGTQVVDDLSGKKDS